MKVCLIIWHNILIQSYYSGIIQTNFRRTFDSFCFNTFPTNVPILYPLKTPGNRRLSVVFRRYKIEILVRNVLMKQFLSLLAEFHEKYWLGVRVLWSTKYNDTTWLIPLLIWIKFTSEVQPWKEYCCEYNIISSFWIIQLTISSFFTFPFRIICYRTQQ